MILIGRYLSPFVRRVGTALAHYGIFPRIADIVARAGKLDAFRRTMPSG